MKSTIPSSIQAKQVLGMKQLSNLTFASRSNIATNSKDRGDSRNTQTPYVTCASTPPPSMPLNRNSTPESESRFRSWKTMKQMKDAENDIQTTTSI
ncbi:hypothetical protein TSUD_146010 [Trifolium subterraneum]|uniref:Uncharacterized protein n=1 Tax=Trifolium subterraneum TaxID=3900 RepID=A0A2Z6N7K7_TRISU|nr:hypothetical protein TSUD_146010 [Trifolium subterraneum]